MAAPFNGNIADERQWLFAHLQVAHEQQVAGAVEVVVDGLVVREAQHGAGLGALVTVAEDDGGHLGRARWKGKRQARRRWSSSSQALGAGLGRKVIGVDSMCQRVVCSRALDTASRLLISRRADRPRMGAELELYRLACHTAVEHAPAGA